MNTIYLTDKARKIAIEDIWAEIDDVLNLKHSEMSYSIAAQIIADLNTLADLIYNEVEDKQFVKRYKEA